MDFFNVPLVIDEKKLAEIEVLVDGKQLHDNQEFMAFMTANAANAENFGFNGKIERRGNTVVLPVSGVLSEDYDFWTWLFSGSSTKELHRAFMDLVADDSVSKIILSVNSPGGSIGGVSNFAEDVYKAREKKEIVAVIGTQGASGGYWIASAAEKVYLASDTSMSGSIGVVMSHRDISKMQDRQGVKTTEVFAGQYKRIVSSYKPLDQAGLETLQGQVDFMYQVFSGSVAKFRGVSDPKKISAMAEGKIFIGSQAVDVGLADGIKTVSEVLVTPAKAQDFTTIIVEDVAKMDIATLQKDFPLVYDAIFQLGVDAGKEKETARIKGIEDISIDGFESVVDAKKYDGKTTAADLSVEILTEQKKNRGAGLDALQGDAKPATFVPGTPEPNEDQERTARAQRMATYAKN